MWYNKGQPENSEIPASPEIAVGMHFHAQTTKTTKTTLVFLPADREASRLLLLPGPVSLLLGRTV